MTSKRIVPWINEADYEAFKGVCHDIPPTFAEWQQLRLNEISQIEARGVLPEIEVVDPGEFASYLRACAYDKGGAELLYAFAATNRYRK